MARLIIKRIQNLRKETGLEITDRISVVIENRQELVQAVEAFKEHIAAQVLANALTTGEVTDGVDTDFGEFTAKISTKRFSLKHLNTKITLNKTIKFLAGSLTHGLKPVGFRSPYGEITV